MNLPAEIPPIDGLTDQQAAFVAHYVANGGKKKLAATRAGYSPEHASKEAHRLLQKDHVINAIYQASVRQLGAHLPGAVKTAGTLSVAANSEYVKLMAAQDVMNRVGLSAPKKVNVSGQFSVSIDLS